MFGWFRPKCPVEANDRAWIEDRFRWLSAQFGVARPRQATVVLPTPEFFPDPYDGSPKSVRRMLNRVSGYLRIDPRRIRLKLYTQQRPPTLFAGESSTLGAAGLYESTRSACPHEAGGDEPAGATSAKAVIWVERSLLEEPTALVATLAHELGHELLLGEGRVSADAEDHEPLTDLLTVYLGLGVFTANSRVRDHSWRDGQWEGWRINRLGYLNARQVGYGLALFAALRAEEQPAWASHLKPDARAALRQGLSYLMENDDEHGGPLWVGWREMSG